MPSTSSTSSSTSTHICMSQRSTFALASKLSYDIAERVYFVNWVQHKEKRSYEERLDYVKSLFLGDDSRMSLPDCITIEEIAESVHTIHYLTGKKFQKKRGMASPLVFEEEEDFEDQLGAFYYVSAA